MNCLRGRLQYNTTIELGQMAQGLENGETRDPS